jgi:hypothetical protein
MIPLPKRERKRQIHVEVDDAGDAHSLLGELDRRGLDAEIRGASGVDVVVTTERDRAEEVLFAVLLSIQGWRPRHARGPVSLRVDDRHYRLGTVRGAAGSG